MRRNRLTALAALLVLGVPATARAQTFWDFVALNGPNPAGPGGDCSDNPGVQTGRCTYTNGTIAGNDKTVTKAGFGTVGFNAINGQPVPQGGTYLTVFQWFADQTTTPNDEKGVGVCRTDDVGAVSGHTCAPGAGGEVGESNSSNDAQWLILDLTGLTTGSILNSVTLASLTNNEAYRFLVCDTQAHAETQAGGDPGCGVYAGNSSANVLTVAVLAADQGKRWIRFQAGAGADGSCGGPTCHGDYLVQGISTTIPEPGTMVLLATGLVGLAGAGTLRRRKRNQ